MMVVVLIAGMGLVLAGLLAVGFGIPVKEFSFGNTLIVTGVVALCTGAIILGLWVAVRELKTIAWRLGSGMAAEPRSAGRRPAVPGNVASGDGGFLFARDQEAVGNIGSVEPADPASPPPWHDEAASRGRHDAPRPESAEPASPPKRRNLLFSSMSRKERERAQARSSEPLAPDLLPSDDPPPATFDDAWPKPDRARPDVPPRRTARTPPTFSEANGAAAPDRYPPARRNEEQAPVTVLRSGVVDGMAYSLYSDGSIEAQMPEGLMRFSSIDELRSHLEHRP
ncbi:DUF308 domain-containing protein [Bradyrhizobium sp.]|uniref:DUF308 domain-containing protein n=1 Tax=Bradyrhizobium sp. TaxID=376 RepID=UPI003C738F3D